MVFGQMLWAVVCCQHSSRPVHCYVVHIPWLQPGIQNKPSSQDSKQSPQAPVCCQLDSTFALPTFAVASLCQTNITTAHQQQLPARNRFGEKNPADVTCTSGAFDLRGINVALQCFCSKSYQTIRNHVGVDHRRCRGRELRGALHSVFGCWYDRLGKDSTGKTFHGYGKYTDWSICSRFAKLPC